MDYCAENEALESPDMEYAWKILAANKKNTFVVAQIAPAVRVALGEKFGFARGEDSALKVANVLRAIGVDAVVDSAIAADAIALMQVDKLNAKKSGGNTLPVFSAECPCWVKHAKEQYPEIELLPTTTEFCARLLKKHYREAEGKTVRVIALEMGKGKKSVGGADVVLTLDELTRILQCTEVNLRLQPKSALDAPLGVTSGAAYVAAASGGQAEAVARCLVSDKTRTAIQKLAYSGIYGKSARREACIKEGETEWKFAVVSSIEEADALIADVKNGVAEYDFVEVCCKEGGCLACGLENNENADMTLKLRGLGLRYLDRKLAARSADMSAGAWLLVREWDAMVRSGEAFAENEEFVEEPIEEYEVVAEICVEEPAVEEAVEEIVQEPAVEETVEEIVEEPAVEETVEETVEEPAVEEAVEETVEEIVEEPVVEETVEEIVEEPAVEETVEENVEEPAVEEAVEETVEEPAVEEAVEEIVEEPAVEEAVEEDVEEPAAEEAVEEIVEEPAVEEAVEEIVKKPAVEEVAVEEAPVEEGEEELDFENMSEEERMKRDPYYRRYSNRERRKKKRKNKNNGK
ncbi:MAG: hypothetical protein IJD77_04440 [Clostridia bacterium]|nr:hypothetical protein [Clostridia bacterium]